MIVLVLALVVAIMGDYKGSYDESMDSKDHCEWVNYDCGDDETMENLTYYLVVYVLPSYRLVWELRRRQIRYRMYHAY